jgi:DNA repair exonuclease SbcCD ATPase subunit
LIRFNYINLKNFMSVGSDPLTFNYSTGLHYVYGENYDVSTDVDEQVISNGSGKTVILVDALLFALFGKTQRKVKMAEIVNIYTGCECEVTVNFTKDKDVYEITRGLKPDKITISVNGEDLNEEAKKRDSNKFIVEQILDGISFEVFRNLIVLNGTSSKHFFEYGRQEKRQFINEVFKLGFLDYLQDHLTEEVKDKKNNIDKMKIIMEQKQNEVERLSNLFECYVNGEVMDNSEKIRMMLEEEVKKINLSQKEMNELLVEMGVDAKTYAERLASAEEQLVTTSSDIVNLTHTLNRMSGDFKSKREHYLSISKQSSCHFCHQTLPEQLKEELMSKVKGEALVLKESGEEDLKKKKELESKKEKMVAWIEKARELVNKYNSVCSEIKNSQSLIDQYKGQVGKPKNIDTNKIQTEINTLEKDLESYKKELEEFEKDYTLHKISREIVNDKNFYGYYINMFRRFLNKKINEYLEEMASPHRIKFNNDLEADVFDNNTNIHSYDNLSTGEKAKINIALLVSFFDVLNQYHRVETSILVLDEVLDQGIDSEGVRLLHTILKRKVGERKGLGIYVVSHKNATSTWTEQEDIKKVVFQRRMGMTSLKEDK